VNAVTSEWLPREPKNTVPITAIPTAPPICCAVLNSPDAPPAASAGAAASTTLTSGMTSSASPARPRPGPAPAATGWCPSRRDGRRRPPRRCPPPSLPAGHFPNLTALSGHFTAADPDERFELLLDIFVDGLARRAAAG